ncbi:MAG: 5-guanidino-2-oxopentanoate decarboxylase [Sulfitobacter sp.]
MTLKKTVGEVLVDLLEHRGVDTVFGIPGVHTVEMYRGLAASNIRHITPRHELSAGFMADGYARASGKPGVCLLITGPGLTNAISAMAQARADSIPMLVISGVNRIDTQGHETGHLHELPDQGGMMRTIAVFTQTVQRGADLEPILDRAFAAMTSGRPGPVHIEVPLDVMSEIIEIPKQRVVQTQLRHPAPQDLQTAADMLAAAKRPVILAGGGTVAAQTPLISVAEKLDAPVVTTINARGVLGGHPLEVPASPSLGAVRDLLAQADVVLAIGTQFGPTDYDMNVDGNFPQLAHLIRIDVDALQATRGVLPDLTIVGDAALALAGLSTALTTHNNNADGTSRAEATRTAAFAELGPAYKEGVDLIKSIGEALPGCLMVGDSTQLVYAGNCYANIARPRGWFNSSVGYGSLGYGAPAAIGARLAQPDAPVVCIIGDGGFQFCLSELGTAMDEDTPVIFLVWNNSGYQEIENYMVDAQIAPIGVRPSAPDFVKVAAAYGMGGETVTDLSELVGAILRAHETGKPQLIEYTTD